MHALVFVLYIYILLIYYILLYYTIVGSCGEYGYNASQLTDESTEAPKIDVAHIYLQAVGVEPKKRRVYGLGTHASTFYQDSVSSSSSASSHYNTLFDERLREELQEIQ